MATRDELRIKAKELKIAGRGSMNKAQLQAAIDAVESVEVVELDRKDFVLVGPAADVARELETVDEASVYLGLCTKGEARRIRKALRAAGKPALAAAPRFVTKALGEPVAA